MVHEFHNKLDKLDTLGTSCFILTRQG